MIQFQVTASTGGFARCSWCGEDASLNHSQCPGTGPTQQRQRTYYRASVNWQVGDYAGREECSHNHRSPEAAEECERRLIAQVKRFRQHCAA